MASLVVIVVAALAQTAGAQQSGAGAPAPASKTGATKAGSPAGTAKAAPAKQAAGKAAPAKNQTQAAPLNPQEIANRLAELHEEWGPGLGSPIGSISLKEVAQQGAIRTYNLYASGLPSNILYTVVAWPVTQAGPIDVVKGVALDPVGLAVCPGQLGTCGTLNEPNRPANLSATILPGRPVRVGLVAMDGSGNKAFTKFVPIPIAGTDKGCRIEAVMLMANGEIALIEGAGFAPMSEVTMTLENGDSKNAGKTTVDSKGEFAATVIPVKPGVTSGVMNVSVQAAACHPVLGFEWGRKDAASAPGSAAPAPASASPAAPKESSKETK